MDYEPQRGRIRAILVNLIEREGITQFYSGNRENIDRLCSGLVHEMKELYPHIRNTMMLSYRPTKDFILSACYDDSFYLLERSVLRAYAILETNKKLVENVDVIVSGDVYDFDGAYKAYDYALKMKKIVINVIE